MVVDSGIPFVRNFVISVLACQNCADMLRDSSSNLSRRCCARRYLPRRGWDSGFEPHDGIKAGLMVFKVVAVVIRQHALKSCLWQIFLGAHEK